MLFNFHYIIVILKFNVLGVMYDELAVYFKAKKFAKVKLFRTKVREGLIRGRLQAAKEAIGEVDYTVLHCIL